jgi:hypothetical protein
MTGRVNPSCYSAITSTTYVTLSHPGLNPRLRGLNPACNLPRDFVKLMGATFHITLNRQSKAMTPRIHVNIYFYLDSVIGDVESGFK